MESYNVDAIQYLCKVDSNLEKIIKIVGKYSINIRNDPFQSLVESIIYQQLAGRAANAIYNRFINYYNNKQITPARILNSPNDNLKKVGLSNRKIDYLKNLASHVYDGRINLEELPKMNDEEIINKLLNRGDLIEVLPHGICGNLYLILILLVEELNLRISNRTRCQIFMCLFYFVIMHLSFSLMQKYFLIVFHYSVQILVSFSKFFHVFLLILLYVLVGHLVSLKFSFVYYISTN